MNATLLYSGSLLITLWGIAHLFPTTSVVHGFGTISIDNRRIVTMEWLVEGVALVFIGVLVALVTALDPLGVVSKAVYLLAAAGLLALALVSACTGAQVKWLPIKLCPLI